MKSFAALALVATVSARPLPNEHHHKHHPEALDFGFGHQLPTQTCTIKPEDRLNDQVFYRELMGEMYNSAIKGLYRAPELRPVSEDCMGNWIDTEIASVLKPLI